MAPWITKRPDGAALAIKVQPRASRNAIGPALGNELKIALTAPPVDAAANQALVELLADRLNCSRGAVQIIRGHASRRKVVFVRDLSPQVIEQALLVQ